MSLFGIALPWEQAQRDEYNRIQQQQNRTNPFEGTRTAMYGIPTGIAGSPGNVNQAALQNAQVSTILGARQNASNTDYGGSATPDGTSATYGGTGGGTGTAAPTYDIAPLKNAAATRINQLRDAYNLIFGDINTLAQDRRGQLDTQYNDQFDQASKAYGKAQETLPGVYAARGLGQSSYFDNALGDATNTYQTDVKNLNTSRDTNYADIGKFVATNKANFQGGLDSLNQVDPNAYGADATGYSGLQSLNNDLAGQLSNLTAQRAGLGTNSQFKQQLNSVAPATQQTSQKLAAQLSNIVNSSVSPLAKQQIASGLIRSISNGDKTLEDYWSKYFASLLMPQAPTQVQTQQAAVGA